MERSLHSRSFRTPCTFRHRCRQSPQRSIRFPSRSMWMIMYLSVSSTLVTVCAFNLSCFLRNVSMSTSILFLSVAVHHSPQKIRCIGDSNQPLHRQPAASKTLRLQLHFRDGNRFFFRLEVEQVRLSRLFGARSQRIEEAFADPSRIGRRFPVPYIATAIFEDSQDGRSASSPHRTWWRLLWPLRTSAILHRWKSWRRKVLETWKIWRSAHIFFYAVLMVLAFVPVGVRYPAVIRHMSQIRSDIHLFFDPVPPRTPSPPSAPAVGVKK